MSVELAHLHSKDPENRTLTIEVNGNFATSISFMKSRDIVGLKLQSAFNYYFWLGREGLREENGWFEMTIKSKRKSLKVASLCFL